MRVLSVLLLLFVSGVNYALPKGFVYLDQIAPGIKQSLAYASSDNFVGQPIIGYKSARCILTLKAAKRLARLQEKLKKQGLGLKVYDCYRPQQAVNHFFYWSQSPSRVTKQKYYPREHKGDLFRKGYIAKYSGHSRGSTVDLTLVSQGTKARAGVDSCYLENRARDDSLDMGTNWDCLDRAAHYRAKVSKKAKKNRRLLRRLMNEQGFRPYKKEWWHFTLRQEPYPRQYFNFEVK